VVVIPVPNSPLFHIFQEVSWGAKISYQTTKNNLFILFHKQYKYICIIYITKWILLRPLWRNLRKED
jgi:hypothetical protein